MVDRDIIIDIGTFEIRLGEAGKDYFNIIEPTIYADSNNSLIQKTIISSLSEMARERFYGKNAMKFKDVLNIQYFLTKKDFKSLAILINQIFEASFLDPRDFGIVLIIHSGFSEFDKNNLQKELFKELKCKKISFMPASACILSVLGLDTGVIIDVGFSTTRIDSIFKGFPNQDAHNELPIGGYNITQKLVELLFSRFKYKSPYPLIWIAEDLKKAVVECQINLDEIIQSIQEGNQEYDKYIELPDGKQFIINRERFECVEPFFNPDLAHVRSDNIVQLTEQSIRTWERSQVPLLVENIVLCGNSAQIPGFHEKYLSLITKSFPKTLNVRVLPLDAEKNNFWIGASILYNKKQGNLQWIENTLEE